MQNQGVLVRDEHQGVLVAVIVAVRFGGEQL